MSNGDDAMSPAEFAKLMGAYPEPSGNPLPAYGGYMDNSAANFSWVNNNDYFGNAETFGADSLTQSERYMNQHSMKGGHKYVECNFCSEKKPLGQMRRMAFDPETQSRVRYSGYLSTYACCDDCYRERFKGKHMGKSVLYAESFSAEGEWCCLCDGEGCEECEDGSECVKCPNAKYGCGDGAGCREHDTCECATDVCGYCDEEYTHYAHEGNYHTCPKDRGDYYDCIVCGVDLMPIVKGQTDGEWITCEGGCGYFCGHHGSGEDFLCPKCGKHEAETFEGGLPKRERLEMEKNQREIKKLMDEKGLTYEEARQMKSRLSDKEFERRLKDYLDMRYGKDKYHEELVKEAQYGGTGAIMGIAKDTPLEQFTDDELTKSSAIHGDFNTASLNYSGHQNIEVRAESPEEFAERHTYYGKCLSCGDIAVDSVSVLTCLSCGQEHKYMEGRGIVLQAEMDIVADGMAVVSNIRDDVVGIVEVVDDKDDDEMVELSIQDEDMNEIGSFTLDDGELMDDYDDYLAESKLPPVWTLALGAVAAIFAYPYLKDGANKVFRANNDVQEILENDPELIENPDIGDLDPAQYEELVVESTGYAVDIIPMGLDGSFMGSRFSALPTERYVDYNDPGIGAHTDIALDRDEVYLEPEMAMVQASETEVKETQAPGQSPYFQMGQEPLDMNYRVLKETHPVSLDPAVKPFIPQSMTGYTGNANTPPSVYNKMFNIGVLGQTPAFVPGDTDMGANHFGSRDAKPDMLGLGGSVGGPLSDQVNLSYTDGTTTMSLAQWAIENTVSQSSDTEAVVIDRSSGAMKRIRRV